MSAFGRIPDTQQQLFRVVFIECLLSSKAVIQVARIERFSTTAFGQERT